MIGAVGTALVPVRKIAARAIGLGLLSLAAGAAAVAQPARDPFQGIDTNGDGVLSIDEMRAVREKSIGRLDGNRDGRISLQEFISQGRPGGRTRSPTAFQRRLFARLDTDGDGFISRAEREASLKRLFARFDANGDGRITRTEFEAARRGRGRSESGSQVLPRATADRGARGAVVASAAVAVRSRFVTPPAASSGVQAVGGFFERADANGDGAVTFDEMRRARDAMVARIDANGDGRISLSEFLDFKRPGPVRQRSPEWRRRVFARIDADGDGFVSAAEREASLKRRFARLDGNGDGRISRAELDAARARQQKRRAARTGAESFRQADRDGDGKLSLEEVVAARARLLRKMDADRDGRVTKDEFVKFTPPGEDKRPGFFARQRRLRLFASFDRDRDGVLTADEQAAVVTSWFKKADVDRDGQLTASELSHTRTRLRTKSQR